jgi:hypothetical protein
MRLRVAALAVILAFPSLVSSALAQSADPVAGAWELVSAKNLKTGEMQQLTTPPLHVVYRDGHYVQFAAAANRTKGNTPRAEMTKEQLVERYNLQGQYGTYRVAGNKLTRRTISAALPDNEGRENSSDFRIEGDTLIVTATGANGGLTESRYRRLK